MERLLEYFTPKNYQISLNINKTSRRVYATTVITGEPKSDTIKLHAKNLKITSVEVDGEPVKYDYDGDVVIFSSGDLREERRARIGSSPVTNQGSDEVRACSAPRNDVDSGPKGQTGRTTGAPEENIPHQLRIAIKYTFFLNTNMQGAYLSSYDYKGEKELLVSTQFESHYARECFPCIDEPAAKATFDLKLITPDTKDTALSNTPVKEEKIVEYDTVSLDQDPSKGVSVNTKAKKKIITFKTTPKMSTYLLAFCLGRFKSYEKTNKNSVKVTTYCTLNHSESCLKYPTEVACRSLEFYDDHFDEKYPLEKLDQVAIPDFEAGAMENWGLVTYRESCLLVDKNTSIESKQYVALVICHELSHQWFGDLVTMKWWDNLWLNESFASVMEYICVDALFPEYKIWQDFYTGECLSALSRDALPGVQAVQQDVNDPEEIATLFDGAIVYAKGAHLMFQLYRLMGEKAFFKGLRDYFNKYKYGNTTGDDLWANLQKYADFDVKNFMDAWILQPGYPVITDDEQQRFLLTGATDDTKWPLPEVTDDMSGHYLLNLSGEEFAEKLANFTNLSLEQRLRLLIDRMLLSKTSIVSSASLVELLPYFKEETSFPIWEIISTIMGSLKVFYTPEDADFKNFQAYLENILSVQAKRLGILNKKKEDENDVKLRSLILANEYYCDNKEISSTLAKMYSDDYSALDPELRLGIFRAKMSETKEKILGEFIKRYQSETDPDIRSDLLCAISGVKNSVSEALSLLNQPEVVRPQDHIYLFAYLSRNFYTHNGAFDWITNNWEYLEEMTGEKSIEDYPRILASTIRTIDDSKRFEEFFGVKADLPVLRRTIEVAKGEINARLRLISLDRDDVHTAILTKNQ